MMNFSFWFYFVLWCVYSKQQVQEQVPFIHLVSTFVYSVYPCTFHSIANWWWWHSADDDDDDKDDNDNDNNADDYVDDDDCVRVLQWTVLMNTSV